MNDKKEFLEVSIVDHYYDNGFCLPVKKFKIEQKQFEHWQKKVKTEVDEIEGDSFADCIGIDSDEKVLFIGSGAREYFEDQKEELEDWLREFFLANDVYAILGFMRQKIAHGEL